MILNNYWHEYTVWSTEEKAQYVASLSVKCMYVFSKLYITFVICIDLMAYMKHLSLRERPAAENRESNELM